MTVAEIARRANGSVLAAIRYLSTVMRRSITAESVISRETAGFAILTLALESQGIREDRN